MSVDEQLRAAVERVSKSSISVEEWWSRRARWSHLVFAFSGALLAAETAPDCFMPDGDSGAADRWADDGGRA